YESALAPRAARVFSAPSEPVIPLNFWNHFPNQGHRICCEQGYLEVADVIQRYGAEPTEDLHELWRRIVFSVLISNTDDHLRNHGFLYEGNRGWRLSPAYDLNPVPVQFRPRVLSTLINEQDGA